EARRWCVGPRTRGGQNTGPCAKREHVTSRAASNQRPDLVLRPGSRRDAERGDQNERLTCDAPAHPSDDNPGLPSFVGVNARRSQMRCSSSRRGSTVSKSPASLAENDFALYSKTISGARNGATAPWRKAAASGRRMLASRRKVHSPVEGSYSFKRNSS